MELPKPTETSMELTWHAPNILLELKTVDGTIHRTVRDGGARQLAHRTRVNFTDAPVDEHDKVFAIRAQNQVNIGGARINVINDAINEGDLVLPATSPTASEYLALVGKEVMIDFDCYVSEHHTKHPLNLEKKTYYKIARIFITIP